MTNNTRPIQFRDYLPKVFRADEVDGTSFFSQFLRPFETQFEDLEAAIEGTPGSVLQLPVESLTDTTITVTAFTSGPVGYPIGTPITVPAKPLRTVLQQNIPANTTVSQIAVQDEFFVTDIEPGDKLELHPGGIPDLFNPDTTPPPQFPYRPLPDFDYLNYLASWIALPLRTDLIRREAETDEAYAARRTEHNRQFFKTAISLYPQRSTLPGMEALLRAWLKGELLETEPPKPPLPIFTDLTRVHTDVDTVFQLGEAATLGVNTVLGEGPPFFFIVDLVTDPTVPELRNPVGLDTFQRTVRFILDAEKPANTYYQLRVRAHTMQLPEPGQTTIDGQPGAQIGKTTLLWEEPWIFDSDC